MKIINIVRDFLDGRKTVLGFIAVFVYAVLVQFAGVPNSEAVWAFIVTFTGVSGVIHVNKV